MSVGAVVSLALGALLRDKMRSLLTTLGVVIGVAAVVTMQAMGQGATAYVGGAISGLGSDMLIAIPGGSRTFGHVTLGVPLFTLADVEAIRKEARDLRFVAPASSRTLRVVSGANNRLVNVGGVAPQYFEIRDWHVLAGRALDDGDERQAALVCLVGIRVRDALFSGREPIGQEIRIQNLPCRIVGVLESKGASAFGIDQDDVVFMPFTTFSRRILGNDRVGTIIASAVSSDRVAAAKEAISSILRRRRHIVPGEEDDFGVQDPREIQALLQSVTGMLTLLLAGVAAISLLVGGIGIMNIMLVSVTERTREIGIRRAVGARSIDILSQFLVESVALSSVGGAIGVALGIGAATAITNALHIPFVVPFRAPALALGVAVLVGVIFGVFPARKAARLNPLAALRFE